ncbi:hypothetical protein FISHEDRAFT_36386 [Fistulina hepatica ATCC 64428]|uniref:Zn(2)-C6 fungal-type domain-containing protein n=1 Tax=Fistulina hepatica ATCC 64428 TaxID=1128425 RepID=A0A0D7AJ07_9AGAR|nr:hypothetical protein FISHEDRAFT_36386 [Fistulina hepatica ATCC 64428]
MSVSDNETPEPAMASPQHGAPPIDRRFKLNRACDRCRRRRIKCDEGHPCQACLTAKSDCTFEPGKRSPPKKSKRAVSLEERMRHLEALIQAIPPAILRSSLSPTHLASLDQLSPLSPEFPVAPGAPPSSFHVFPATNPSSLFSGLLKAEDAPPPAPSIIKEDSTKSSPPPAYSPPHPSSYLYFDDEGCTRWQGSSSGLPLLDLLVERQSDAASSRPGVYDSRTSNDAQSRLHAAMDLDWFPHRTTHKTTLDPQTMWSLVSSAIAPDLMDNLVRCYLSTTGYLLPFLHVPTFLKSYSDPQAWSEPGFAALVVSMCCLAARHCDDPRVRADPASGLSAGAQWFDLLSHLHTIPTTSGGRGYANASLYTAAGTRLYSVQAALLAAVFAIGLGRLTRGAALLSEAVTLCIDSGLHRATADGVDANTHNENALFDPVEDQVRIRTFWCVYIWDKQFAAYLGRPPTLRLRDCNVREPVPVADEYISRDGKLPSLNGTTLQDAMDSTTCHMQPFVILLRISVVLEAVLEASPPRATTSPFLRRASELFSRGDAQHPLSVLSQAEAILDEVRQGIPAHWAHTSNTLESTDPVRVTQTERIHAAEQFVRLLIHRQALRSRVARDAAAERNNTQIDTELAVLAAAHTSATEIVSTHVRVVRRGLMTYYGVHVIHQLAQAGRTLVAVLLRCRSEASLSRYSDVPERLFSVGLEALRSCLEILRKFSARYVCALRAVDVLDESCRLSGLPIDAEATSVHDTSRPMWMRPVVRRRSRSSSHDSSTGSPTPRAMSEDVPWDIKPRSDTDSVSSVDSPLSCSPPQPLAYTQLRPASPAFDARITGSAYGASYDTSQHHLLFADPNTFVAGTPVPYSLKAPSPYAEALATLGFAEYATTMEMDKSWIEVHYTAAEPSMKAHGFAQAAAMDAPRSLNIDARMDVDGTSGRFDMSKSALADVY